MRKLDARGRICPLPLFYTKKTMEEMNSGEELEVIANDSTAKQTIPEWAGMHDHKIIEMEDQGDYFKIVLRKK